MVYVPIPKIISILSITFYFETTNKIQLQISKPFLSIKEKLSRNPQILVGSKSTYMHVLQ
jgi:hypothetical protein